MRVVDLLLETQLPHLAQQVSCLDPLHLLRVAQQMQLHLDPSLPQLIGHVKQTLRLPRPVKARPAHPEHHLRLPPFCDENIFIRDH